MGEVEENAQSLARGYMYSGGEEEGDWDLQVGLCANGRSSLQESTVKTKNCEESLLVDLFNKPDTPVPYLSRTPTLQMVTGTEKPISPLTIK